MSGKHSRAHEQRRIAEGCLRVPGVILGYEASESLKNLLEAGWEPSKAKCIERALIMAAKAIDIPRGT